MTTLLIPSPLSLWEAIATVQIAQALQEKDNVAVVTTNPEHTNLFFLAGITRLEQGWVTDGPLTTLSYDSAYRKTDQGDRSYPTLLAEESGLKDLKLSHPRFPLVIPKPSPCILVAPFGIKQELDLPISVWRSVVRFLRSYPVPVYLMAGPGQRQDQAAYTEGEILSELPLVEKIKIIAGASLVIGVPNEWLWLATAFNTRLITLYPDRIPPKRWFPFASDNFGRILYEAHRLEIPVILVGLRKLIREF